MASSLISRSHHIDFDSVFRFDDAEIVQMFESLVTTGLMEFLGCPAIFHECALIEFFANGSVRDGMVVSTIGGIAVEIRESVFAETFGLPTEGLTDLSEVPRNLLSEAQSLFSASEKEVSISCLKKEVKMQYRLLSDILAKSLFVKAGRQAASEAEVAPVIKKKRSTKGKPAAARRISLDKQVEDTTADDVDMIIRQVISESTDLSSHKTDQGHKPVDETDIGDDFGACDVEFLVRVRDSVMNAVVALTVYLLLPCIICVLVFSRILSLKYIAGTLTLYHLSEMASSLISRSHHIDFDSIFRFDDAEIVQMFESLVTTGLMEFLGCPAIFHESALIEFFANGSVRDGMVVSTIGGIAVEIRESVFAETFGLPTEGLTDLSELQVESHCLLQLKVSCSGGKVASSRGDNLHWKVPVDWFTSRKIPVEEHQSQGTLTLYHLSEMASSLISRSHHIDFDSFFRFDDAGIVQMFESLVTTGLMEFLGCPAIIHKVLLSSSETFGLLTEGLTDLSELGESKAFPAPRILNDKTIHRIVSVNANVGVEEVGEAPRAKQTPVKKSMSKKRQAASEAEVAPVIKKKRSTKGKPAAARRISLEAVARRISLDDVDMIIRQVISESTDLSSNKEDQGDKLVDETDIGDDFGAWLDSSFPGFDSRVDEPVLASTNLEKATSSRQSAEVHMSFDDLLLQIPNDMLLPSITTAEVSMLRLDESSSFRDKGKAILVKNDQLTENPATEIVALVCSDVEFLVRVRDSVMNAVVDFFASFSLNNMPDMESLKDLKEKEKMMMKWAETTTLATAVRRQMYVLAKYREMLLRTFVESYSRYLECDQPWNNMAVQVFSLLSAAHSQSLDDLKAQQLEHNFELVQPTSSPPVLDCTDCSGVRLAQFYSIAKSIKKLPASVTAEYFDSAVPLIEPARYWGTAPLLVKFWAWQRVCTEAIQFSISGRLRSANFSSDIVIRNLGVERLPDYFLDDFEHGVNTGYFADFLSGSSGHSGSDFDSASSSGDTVYSPDSSPAAPPLQESSSSSSDASIHFDSEDLPVHGQEAAHTSAPVDSNAFTNEDLRSYISQRIHESTSEIPSKIYDATFNVRGDLLKQQAWLRQTFQDACDVLERQRKEEPVDRIAIQTQGTIYQDASFYTRNDSVLK
ncbi:putative phosphoserine phosphatase [Dorcoceras hygrometricum]|uniref:Putative phosphoserine phosphatase n=1 Tax=Dorcoceras hygrometricum TaxID=472368 RepID=A0A2Z7BPX0_9LAMI|nr:putative phosphoserine phosphatase [Dorcoceras hygrometricum]